MPKIPQWEGSTDIKTPNLPEMGTESVSRNERAQRQFTGELENIEDSFAKIRSFRETNEANAFTFEQVNAQISQADNDIDLDPKKYEDAIDKIGVDASKNITSTLAREEFMANYQRQATAAKWRIRNDFKAKELKAADATIEYQGKQIIENFGGLDDATKASSLANYKLQLQKGVELGLYNQDTADQKWLEFSKKVFKGEVDYDIARDTATSLKESFTYNQLQLGEEGRYSQLSSQDKSSALDSIQKKVRRNQFLYTFEQNKNQNNNEAKMLIDLIDGNLTETVIKDQLLSGDVRRSFGEKMFKRLYDNPNPETNLEVYNKIRMMQLSGADVKEINQAVLDDADKLSNEDKKFIINKAISQEDKKNNIAIKYNAEALKNWADKRLSLMPDIQNDLIYEFHRRVNQENAQGPRIDEIAQELQKERIKEIYPDSALTNDVPNFIMDRNKLRKVYEKESKLKGKSTPSSVQVNVGTGGDNIDFDSL